MLALTQLLMRPTEIGGTADQVHPRLKGFETLSRMATFARQGSQTLAHGGIEAVNQGGIELLASGRQGQQVLRFLKRSQAELARDFHHPFPLAMLENGGKTQIGPDY